MNSNHSFCSRRARASDTLLAGTATEASTWLLIEVPAPWGRKALAESTLAPSVKSHLLRWEAAAGDRRVQFIRREMKAFDVPGRITIFVAYVGAHPPELYRLCLKGYGDLLALDLEEVGERRLPAGACCRDAPLFLTCTNGRRDACCAKWGRAMAAAMTAATADAAWQTTHLGGHRFAPTLQVLPHGSQYGWLEPDEAIALVEAHRERRLYRLDRYRGHVGFAAPVQAAAVFLRKTVDRRALDALAFVEAVQEEGSSAWRVRFRLDEEAYEVQVLQEEGEVVAVPEGQPSSEDIVVMLSQERILDVDADYIFVCTYADQTGTAAKVREKFQGNPLWNQLKGEIHTVSDTTWMTAVGLLGAHKMLDDLATSFGVDSAGGTG